MILNQCLSILDLTSSDWGSGRIPVVAHSFRVMAKASNFDEMVVCLMHEVYGGSSYARGLFSCDVEESPLWKLALDLFVYPGKPFRLKASDDLTEADLLNLNRPQDLEGDQLNEWLLSETEMTKDYRMWVYSIAANRVARNVLIYDLEDKLRILNDPDAAYGPHYYALPWKKHYVVGIKNRRNGTLSRRVPEDDDCLLLRPISEKERNNLIEKYSQTIELLGRYNKLEHLPGDFSPELREDNARQVMRWFDEWHADTLALEYYEQSDEQWESEDDLELPF